MAIKCRPKGSHRRSYVPYFEFRHPGLNWYALAGDELERVHTGIVEGDIPSNVLRVFRTATGFTIDEMASVIGVSPRTVGRKERTSVPLTTAEADRAVRLTRVMHSAVDSIGDLAKAVRWMRKPNAALRGQVPLRLIESEPGTQLVLAALDRIAYGGVV